MSLTPGPNNELISQSYVPPLNIPSAGGTSVQFATMQEVLEGTSDSVAISPLNLLSLTSSISQRGIVELATISEAISGTDTLRAVTPVGVSASLSSVLSSLNLSVASASETSAGIVELATTAETTTGTDTVRATTPAGVKAAILALASGGSAATETSAGIVELATLAEAQAGTDTTRAVTPANLPFFSTASGVVWRSVMPPSASSVYISNVNANLTSPNTIGIGTNITKYNWSGDNIVIGNNSSATNNGAIAIGFATSAGGNAISIGNGATNNGGQGVSIGRNAWSTSDSAIVIGGGSQAGSTCNKAIVIGYETIMSNGSTLSTCIGSSARLTGSGSIAIGSYVKNTAASTGEIGIWNVASGGSLRASGIRIHGKPDNTDGYVAFTAAKVASTTLIAGASGSVAEGTESHGTLMPSGLTFRVNTSNQLVAVYNDAGTIRTLTLGTLT